VPGRLTLLCLVALAAPADAEPLPGEAAGWEAHLETFYRHYKKVAVRFERGAQDAASCDPKDRLLRELAFEPWRLTAALTPRDPKLFAAAAVTVRRLKPGVDATALFRRAARRKAPHLCWVSKSTHVLAQAGPYWVELVVGCGAGELRHYEIADFLELLGRKEAAPGTVIVSPCGAITIAARPAAELAAEGRKERRLWGRAFPAARQGLRDQAP
jgi:hypothetical protein